MGGATRIFSKQSFDRRTSGAEEGQYLPLHSHTHNPTEWICCIMCHSLLLLSPATYE